MRHFQTFFRLLALLYIGLSAQPPKVAAILSKDTILIGQQVTLTLKVTDFAQNRVSFPILTDTLGANIEILNLGKVDTIKTDKQKYLRQTLTITSFDSGSFAIHPLKFTFKTDQKEDTIFTTSTKLYVNTIAIDTTLPIKDIKNISSLPAPPKDWSWLWYLLLIIPIVAGFYYYIKNRKKQPLPILVKQSQKPAHVWALESLDLLEQEKLWQRNEFKQYHSELTEIVRTYIEKRFNIPALEQTTDQVLRVTRQSRLVNGDLQERLSQLLNLGDMVKFAKYIPIGSENELSMLNARFFIQNTIMQDQNKLES